ncbi:MAG: ATP-binding cassette domain-containing protein [Lachnospiraceae bacterium]|nr:ATP-binding cassette domain-containing protein [Lachnospiraceae bacterium]
MEAAINVSHLKKYFRDVKAVDDISFVVPKGEFFGFLGVNGAGKSTTIHILCTLLKETAGQVEVCGYDVGKQSNAVRRNIGVVFQENTLDGMLTVKENLELRGFLYEKDRRKVQRNLEEVAEILDIGELLSRPFRKLSGGQKRRCEIAKSLMNTPEVLFLDEPTTGLDPQTRKQVWESIERLRAERQMTVFLTTHYMEEAAMAQHLCVMDGGKIVAQASPSELKKQYATDLLKLYTTEIQLLHQEAERLRLPHHTLSNGVAFPLVSTKDAIAILSQIHAPYDGLEVIQGSMDDVFLNVTGKKMEE